MKEKEVKEKEVELKLKKRHPRKSYRLGRHVVEVAFKKFKMNKDEMKELEGKGAKAWIISKEEFDKKKKAKSTRKDK